MKPTLMNLEARFEQNKTLKQPHAARLKTLIDLHFLKKKPQSLDAFTDAMNKEGVTTILRKNEPGFVYGITYIDHKTKCVFNASDLGKAYSAKVVQERCGLGEAISRSLGPNEGQGLAGEKKKEIRSDMQVIAEQTLSQQVSTMEVLDNLLRAESDNTYLPQVFKKGKNKRKGQAPR